MVKIGSKNVQNLITFHADFCVWTKAGLNLTFCNNCFMTLEDKRPIGRFLLALAESLHYSPPTFGWQGSALWALDKKQLQTGYQRSYNS